LHALVLWGERHLPPPDEESRMTIVHAGCGEATTSSDTCSRCGAPLRAGDVRWHRPWVRPEPVDVVEPAS
ncbi:MAG: winged helix-turn-helix transcriptional regulator, partial [Candidatus Dormibacteria bacterium]